MIKFEYQLREGVTLNETDMYNIAREYENMTTAEYFQDYYFEIADNIALSIAEEVRHKQEKGMDWGGYQTDGEILEDMISDITGNILSWLEVNEIEYDNDPSDSEEDSLRNVLEFIYGNEKLRVAFEEYFKSNSIV